MQDIRGPLQTVRLLQILCSTTEPWPCTKWYQLQMEKAAECMFVCFGVLLLRSLSYLLCIAATV
jgi:hypothetical protein